MSKPPAHRFHPVAPGRQQRGVVLPIALIVLLLLLLVGLFVVRGTLIQTKAASNFYDREIAFQSAQAALRQGETYLTNNPTVVPGAFTGTPVRDCSASSAIQCLPNPFIDSTLVPATNVVSVTTANFDPGPLKVAQPEYVIDYLGQYNSYAQGSQGFQILSMCSNYGAGCGDSKRGNSSQTADFFRITARSGPADVDTRATVTLQTIFYRQQ
jgi:type IV pilus assembly protein PilX